MEGSRSRRGPEFVGHPKQLAMAVGHAKGVRRSVVMMVAGAPKTEASVKDVPLDAGLAESLLKLKLTGP